VDMITGGGISHHFTWYYLTAPIAGSILAVLHFNFLLKK